MIVIGQIIDTHVLGKRVLALAHIDFDTHHGNFRLDITPPTPSAINLAKYAKSAIGTPITVEMPLRFVDLEGKPLDYSIGVKP